MLILPIKKKWFDMILAGVKKEEYREIKDYYDVRFKCFDNEDGRQIVKFRNGYSNSSPSFEALCELKIGVGNPEWGAEPGKEYYVLKILQILEKPKLGTKGEKND